MSYVPLLNDYLVIIMPICTHNAELNRWCAISGMGKWRRETG